MRYDGKAEDKREQQKEIATALCAEHQNDFMRLRTSYGIKYRIESFVSHIAQPQILHHGAVIDCY